MFKYIRNRIHRAVMARLNLALSPIQDNVSLLKSNQELYHVQITQMLKSIGEHIQPGLFEAISSIGVEKPVPVGEVVISPNYGLLLRPDDVFLVSYPRSGNTWMRTIIAGILYPHDLFQSLLDLDDYMIDLNIRFPNHNRFSSPRVIKSHQPYHQRDGLANRQLYNRFIYILRHPYKVMTSFYDFERFRDPSLFTDLGTFVEQVVMGGYHFGNWEQHVISWLYGAKRAQSTLFLRYEDLQTQTIPIIMKLAKFLGHSITEQQAKVIQEFSSQENMIEMDKRGAIVPDYEFVRRGEERNIKTQEILTDAMKEMIYDYNKRQMDAWGYTKDGVVLNDYPNRGKYDQ